MYANSDQLPAKRVLDYLREASEGNTHPTWVLSRIIWRAGELEVLDAVPYLAKLHLMVSEEEQFAILWTLARLSTSAARKVLQTIELNHSDPHFHYLQVARAHEEDRAWKEELLNLLDPSYATLVQHGAYDSLRNQLEEDIQKAQRNIQVGGGVDRLLISLYALSFYDHDLREVFITHIPKLQRSAILTKVVKHLFKLAEMRADTEVLAIIAAKIDQDRKQFFHFTKQTKGYLLRRVLRNLRKAGEAKQEFFCNLATDLLCQYGPEHERNLAPQTQWFYEQDTRRWHQTRRYFLGPPTIPYFRFLLFAGTDRFETFGNALVSDSPAMDSTEKREEAFSVLWDTYPQYLIQLLERGKHIEVWRMACKVLQNHPDQWLQLSSTALFNLLRSGDIQLIQAGIQAAQAQYNPKDPNAELVVALLEVGQKDATEAALTWLSNDALRHLELPGVLPALLLNPYDEVDQWLNQYFSETRIQETILKGTLNVLSKAYEKSKDPNNVYGIAKLNDRLITHLNQTLKSSPVEFVLELLNQSVAQGQLLAVEVLQIHQEGIRFFPSDTLLKALESEHEVVRERAAVLLQQLSDEELSQNKMLLQQLLTSPNGLIRNGARDAIGRLAQKDESFAKEILPKLTQILLQADEPEGLHQTIYELIQTYLKSYLKIIVPKAKALVAVYSSVAQNLGAELIDQFVDLNEWSIPEIVSLSKCSSKMVRQLCLDYYSNQVSRIQYEREVSLTIFSSPWEDVRTFAKAYFDQSFSEREWTAEMIVFVIDSIFPDVQRYGKKILNQYGKPEDGDVFLQRLSQHPDLQVRAYVLEYLSPFAFNQLDRLQKLKPYFHTVLSQLNVGKKVKDEVFTFLKKQSMEGADYGAFVLDIMKPLLASFIQKDKLRSIALINSIQMKYGIKDQKNLISKDFETRIK